LFNDGSDFLGVDLAHSTFHACEIEYLVENSCVSHLLANGFEFCGRVPGEIPRREQPVGRDEREASNGIPGCVLPGRVDAVLEGLDGPVHVVIDRSLGRRLTPEAVDGLGDDVRIPSDDLAGQARFGAVDRIQRLLVVLELVYGESSDVVLPELEMCVSVRWIESDKVDIVGTVRCSQTRPVLNDALGPIVSQ